MLFIDPARVEQVADATRQSQGAGGEAVVPLPQTSGNAESGVHPQRWNGWAPQSQGAGGEAV